MKTRSLLLKLSKRFPKSLAKRHHDFVGLMCGKLKDETSKILLCLDFDEEVFEIAKIEKPDLIISHHPFIYGSKAKVLKYDERKRELFNKVLEHDLVVYSMHTNFDEGRGGMNDALARALELTDVVPLEDEPLGRFGTLVTPMPVEEFARYAKTRLNVDYGLLIACGSEIIKTVGIIGGGGSGFFKGALKQGADIYISGDAPHHIRRAIVTSNYNYLDLPHEIEKIFMPALKEILLSYDQSLEILIVDHEKLPKVI